MQRTRYLLLGVLLITSQILSAHAPKSSFHSTTKTDMKYTVLILYRITPAFLNLKREERNLFFGEKVMPIIQKFEKQLDVRMFDSEAFHASTSDFLMVECADLKDYYFFMESLRDTALFGEPYIELKDVIIGIEGGFAAFEAENGDQP